MASVAHNCTLPLDDLHLMHAVQLIVQTATYLLKQWSAVVCQHAVCLNQVHATGGATLSSTLASCNADQSVIHVLFSPAHWLTSQ